MQPLKKLLSRRAGAAGRILAAALALAAVALPSGSVEEPALTTVRVRPGETLRELSQRYLEDPGLWERLLRHNKLPTSDPLSPLPAMTLMVPSQLMRGEFQAARLVSVERDVLSRRNDSPDWDKARKGALLYEGDGLRTLARSRAQVEFYKGATLNVDADSMVILRSPTKSEDDIVLNRGSVRSTFARVITPSARILPRTRATRYTARILDDLSTQVHVLRGAAVVQDNRGARSVEVHEGYSIQVAVGKAPEIPMLSPGARLPAAAVFVPRPGEKALETPVATAAAKQPSPLALVEPSVGAAVAGCEVHVSTEPTFARVLLRLSFDIDSDMDPRESALERGFPDGRYWWRWTAIDLLGVRGKFSEPGSFSIGAQASESPAPPARCR